MDGLTRNDENVQIKSRIAIRNRDGDSGSVVSCDRPDRRDWPAAAVGNTVTYQVKL